MLDDLMQRDVALVIGGALFAGPANALTTWIGSKSLDWWRGRAASTGGNVAMPAGVPEPEGSWLANAVGLAIVGATALAVGPLLIVLVGAAIYLLWRLAWVLGVALWGAATSPTGSADAEAHPKEDEESRDGQRRAG